MRDLRQYISKPREYGRNLNWLERIGIKDEEPTEYQLLSYCVFNSFKREKDQTEGLAQLVANGEEFTLSFNECDLYALDDYNIPANFVRDVILNALLPDYTFQDFVSDVGDTSFIEDVKRVLNQLREFLKSNHMPVRKFLRFVKENADSLTLFYGYSIQSRFLRKIYKDAELKDLFESATNSEFVAPDRVFNLIMSYQESAFDQDYVDRKKIIEFIETFKRKYPNLKRKHKDNFCFAEELIGLDYENHPASDVVERILGTYLTLTEVMF